MKKWFIRIIPIIVFLPLLSVEKEMADLLKNFETYAVEQQKIWEVPGMAIAIVKDQEVVFAKGFGQRGLSDRRLVDIDTLFQMGSLSKAFTSALVAKAVDKELLKWNEKVIQQMPTFRLSDPWVTTEFEIIDLLCQRSGLPPYAGDTQTMLGFTENEIFDHLHHIKPISSFRSQYAYQNVFFGIAAAILEKKQNASFSQLLQKEIFSPLDMSRSSSTLKDYLASNNRAEWLMRLEDGSTVILKDDFPYRNWNYIYGPAGGVNSTARDMAQWLLLQVNEGKFKDSQLISTTNMQRLTRPMIFAADVNNHVLNYALGWVHMANSPYPIIWHDGSTLGVYNVAAFIPEEKLGIVILTNVRNTKLALGLAFDFFDQILKKTPSKWSQTLLAKSKELAKNEPEIMNPSSPQPLSNYLGVYNNPIYGDFEVKEENNELRLVMRKNLPYLVLKPWNRDLFITQWHPIEEDPIKVLFTMDDSGKINKMQIDLFMKEGVGDFEKKGPL
jgi:CubicO group peptidase (beta-lactamase class C family)